MTKEDWLDADIDDPYRTCASCDQKHHEEYGRTCQTYDEWICQNCWNGDGVDFKHEETAEHGRRVGL